MKNNLISLLSGILFAIGLGLSGMMNPQKVKDFLDITRSWDPSLALVMGGALAVTVFTFKFVLKKEKPLLGEKFHLPTRKDIDGKLIFGSALFGIGWGVLGFCPGPAIANFFSGNMMVILFFAIMLITMLITEKLIK